MKVISNPFQFPATYLDNGFWCITTETAGEIAKKYTISTTDKILPDPGCQRLLILEDGTKLWLTQTVAEDEMVWSVRFATAF